MTVPPDNDPMATVRPYVQLASGLLGMSAAKAAELAQGLWTQGSDAVDDGVQAATDAGGQVAALLSPDQIRALVRDEVDRAARRLGFARDDEVASVRREVGRLQLQVTELSDQLAALAAKKASKKSDKKSSKKSASGTESGKGDHS